MILLETGNKRVVNGGCDIFVTPDMEMILSVAYVKAHLEYSLTVRF
jgi:hypothetical protein